MRSVAALLLNSFLSAHQTGTWQKQTPGRPPRPDRPQDYRSRETCITKAAFPLFITRHSAAAYRTATTDEYKSRLKGPSRHIHGSSPNTPTLLVVPTYTLPFTTTGMMNLLPVPNSSALSTEVPLCSMQNKPRGRVKQLHFSSDLRDGGRTSQKDFAIGSIIVAVPKFSPKKVSREWQVMAQGKSRELDWLRNWSRSRLSQARSPNKQP